MDKLIETLNQAIQKAGGEAGRVWPQMVAAHQAEHVVALVFGALLIGVGIPLMVWCAKRAVDAHEDGAGIAAGVVAMACGLAIIVGLVLVPTSITGVLYPEADMVRSLLKCAK